MTRHRELLESAELAEHYPIFRDAERVIADPIVRNRGTIGGSLCQADPSEDLSAVCTALGATLRDPRPRRRARRDHGASSTAARTRPRSAHGEMLAEIRVPIRGRRAAPTRRSSGGPATGRSPPAGAAVWLDGGAVADAPASGWPRSAPNTTGCPRSPRRPARQGAVRGRRTPQAGAIAAEACNPATDQRGTADYKRHLAKELTAAGAAPRRRPERREEA